jgi:hypothetical protein
MEIPKPKIWISIRIFIVNFWDQCCNYALMDIRIKLLKAIDFPVDDEDCPKPDNGFSREKGW